MVINTVSSTSAVVEWDQIGEAVSYYASILPEIPGQKNPIKVINRILNSIKVTKKFWEISQNSWIPFRLILVLTLLHHHSSHFNQLKLTLLLNLIFWNTPKIEGYNDTTNFVDLSKIDTGQLSMLFITAQSRVNRLDTINS